MWSFVYIYRAFIEILVIMPRERINADSIQGALKSICPYLEDTSNAAHKVIYFDGCKGLSASAVLRAIAEHPPSSLLKKFDKIIHVDCSRWKSRRALQRTIAQELKLPRLVMDVIDRQDEEDDFKGIDEPSRAEIGIVGREILRVLMGHNCLVVFHNGSDNTIDLNDFGIPQPDQWFVFGCKVLWTFRGRLRLNPGISEKVDDSHLFLYDVWSHFGWNYLLQEEAKEISMYTDNVGAAVEECCLYLLSLNSQGGNIMDYNWATHASSYWVCDGIIQGGQGDEAWEVAADLHQQIHIEDYSSNALPNFGGRLKTPPKRWILSKDSSVVPPESTSFFLAAVASESDHPLRPLPNDMFHQSNKLRVLKLCRRTFCFSSPPFSCCNSLRFLGLDHCKDQHEEDEKQGRPAMEFFHSLWVLDICHTDWELDLNLTNQMAANIREVHIKKGRIWCRSFPWRQLKNLHKLRVIEPTSSWQTGEMDEFSDMVKMEFLDLSGDSTIQVLPSMSGATILKILVLDGCVGLEHVGPKGLPPSLESFSFDARARGDQNKEPKICNISLAGCARLYTVIHGDEAWEVASALHQQINIQDYSSNVMPSFGYELETPPKRWILSKDSSVVHPESTSFFLPAVTGRSDSPLRHLPNGMFHQSNKLRVLKLCRCTFSFSSPPFGRCHSLKFLGLDHCKDQRLEEENKQDRPTMDFFQSIWVLEICHTDWEFALSPDITQQMARNIREVHIKKGRIWSHSFSWRKLQNIRKLRVVDPTCPWETGDKDDFTNMVKMEFLDLSWNTTIQVLPSLSRESTSIKTLILDGCVGLEHVEGLPPSLESFSLDARPREHDYKEAKLSRISMAGCARLSDFKLRGSLPNLEELDLSDTEVKTLDLGYKVVHVPYLKRIILLRCMQLHAILWPEEGLPTLTVLHIDSSICPVQAKLHEVYVAIRDMRFFQSLVLESSDQFCWKSNRFHLNLCVPCTTNVKGQNYMKEKLGPGNSGKIMGPPQPVSLAPNTCSTYIDVSVGNIIIDHDYNNALRFQPSDCHVEIGKGFSDSSLESVEAIKAIIFAMNEAESLHVHDNSSITTVIAEQLKSRVERDLAWTHLKQCHVVSCPNMHTVFTTDYDRFYYFKEIETFWAANLLMARCIWSQGRASRSRDEISFGKLKSIQLISCPRLTFVLPLFWTISRSCMHNLESLHIVKCGDLKVVFPVHPHLQEDVLEFPSLKHIHLYELYSLQHICEVKMLAPKLERVWLRGCWSLRRLPAIGRDSRPVVDCEKDWWESLEWDGLEADHDPSLFRPRHSLYYKKPLDRVSVLR